MADNDELKQPRETLRGAFIGLLHPIPLTVLLILLSVFALMYPTVFSKDGGNVLTRMADHEFARGLITYLFAVTTIGTAVVLVLAALTGALGNEENYTRGKDILALLLGVFGTIVGFYFGSEAHDNAAPAAVSISQPVLLDSTAAAGDSVRLMAVVSGGTAPYSWAVGVGEDADLDFSNVVDDSGWITATVALPRDTTRATIPIRIAVRDRNGQVTSQQATARIRPHRP